MQSHTGPKTSHCSIGLAWRISKPEAIAEYKKEAGRPPASPEVFYQLGHSLLEIGNWKAAIIELRKATQSDPQNADAAYDLGKALLLDGDAGLAIVALQRSIELKPTDPSPHYQLARALAKMGKEDDARQEWQRF